MLEKVAYVVMIITALAMAYVSLGSGRGSVVPGLEPGIEKGDTVPSLRLLVADELREQSWVEADETLLVFFSTGCPFCLASLPVYRRIAQTRCDVRMVFAVYDRGGSDLEDWWDVNAWGRDDPVCSEYVLGRVVEGADAFGVAGTPSHFLVAPSGEVVELSVGMMKEVPEWLSGDQN